MTPIPCRRPKVTVIPRTDEPGEDRHDADCHVPGCGWAYPVDKQFMALKSDANDQATRHRGEHRAAVPDVTIERAGDGHRWAAACTPCMRVETMATRTDIQDWLDYHLASVHGVVVCS